MHPFAKVTLFRYPTVSVNQDYRNLRVHLRGIQGLISGSGGPNVAEIDEIEQKVIDIVAEQMGVDKAEITRDTSFINDLNADSLDTVELVMEFEDEFEMSIPDEEAEKIQTVWQAIDYIKSVSDKQGP